MTLKSDYLKSLVASSYNIEFIYNDGSVATTFKTIQKTDEKTTKQLIINEEDTEVENPKIKDNILFYMSMLILNIISMVGVGLYIRKKSVN